MRQGHLLAVDEGLLEPREQLGAFLHDGEVGGEVGVEHGVEAQAAQGGDHLAGDQRAGRVAEALAEGGADGRGGLHDHVLGRVVQRVPDLVDLVAFSVMAPTGQTAAHWPHCTQTTSLRLLAKAGPMSVAKPRPCGEQAADALDLVAHGDAAAAR